MEDRLSPLCFIPPPTGTPWKGVNLTSHERPIPLRDPISRKPCGEVCLPSPLFWMDPAWEKITCAAADLLANLVSNLGIFVSAMKREFEVPDRPSKFLEGESRTPRRMIAYRPERYGLLPDDFDDVSIIDLRLAVERDKNGRFAFSPEQIARWEATPVDAPLAGGSWVPAATFPPDIPSIEHVQGKIDQLRTLSPRAAVMISIYPYQLDRDLPLILPQQPDGLILRCNDVSLDGLSLVRIVRRARHWLEKLGQPDLPFWIEPGSVTPSDAVKLMRFGATAIAVDNWCDNLLKQVATVQQQTSFGTLSPGSLAGVNEMALEKLTRETLRPKIDEFFGLSESLMGLPASEHLATTNSDWAKALDVPLLAY